MKLVVMGFGQCGSRIADEFARLNKRARYQRRINVVVDALAVDSDAAALAGLRNIKFDHKHRVLIGGYKVKGAGTDGSSELATEVASDETYRIIDALRAARRFTERDAILLIAGTTGGIGSGTLPITAEMIKQLYLDKPVYSLLVMPFEQEKEAKSVTIRNTAACLRSAYTFSDAVILVDNERYIQKDSSLKNDLGRINEMIVGPFYNLLCSGEEKKAKHIGSKTLDTGEVTQILSGWTAIGRGRVALPLLRLPSKWTRNFRKVSIYPHRGIQAMEEALVELSSRCTVRDAGKALYLLSAPSKATSVQLIADLNEYLRRLVPDAEVRSGDYPRERGAMEVVVILSQLNDVAMVRNYYAESAALEKKKGRKQLVTSKRARTNKTVPRDSRKPA